MFWGNTAQAPQRAQPAARPAPPRPAVAAAPPARPAPPPPASAPQASASHETGEVDVDAIVLPPAFEVRRTPAVQQTVHGWWVGRARQKLTSCRAGTRSGCPGCAILLVICISPAIGWRVATASVLLALRCQ